MAGSILGGSALALFGHDRLTGDRKTTCTKPLLCWGIGHSVKIRPAQTLKGDYPVSGRSISLRKVLMDHEGDMDQEGTPYRSPQFVAQIHI